MKKLPPDILMMICCFIIGWTGRNLSVELPELIQSYLADLCCMPLILYAALQLVRLQRRDENFRFRFMHIAFAWIWVSLLSEGIIPHLTQRYTSDWWDVVVFAMGACYAYLAQGKWSSIFVPYKSVNA